MGAGLIIIRYCCGKQCELLLNRFLIKTYTINLIYHVIYLFLLYLMTKFNPHLFFNPVLKNNFDPKLFSRPPTCKKISTPPSILTIRSLLEGRALSSGFEGKPGKVGLLLLLRNNSLRICHSPSLYTR